MQELKEQYVQQQEHFYKDVFMNYAQFLKEEGKREGKREGILEGERMDIIEGKNEAKHEIALNLLKSDFSQEDVANITGLTLSEVKKLKKKIKSKVVVS